MAFAKVGSILQTATTSLSLNPASVGDLILYGVVAESATVYPTGISGGHCTWTQIGAKFLGTHTTYYAAVFAGQATATGSATATLAFSGTTPTIRSAGQEFSSTVGSWSVDGPQGNLDSTSTKTFPALAPSGPGSLYFGYAYWTGTYSSGSTPGYVYEEDSHSNGVIFNPACTTAAQQPSFTTSSGVFGISVLIRESALSPVLPLMVGMGVC